MGQEHIRVEEISVNDRIIHDGSWWRVYDIARWGNEKTITLFLKQHDHVIGISADFSRGTEIVRWLDEPAPAKPTFFEKLFSFFQR